MAKKPTIYTVRHRDRWANRREGSSRPFGVYDTKAEALAEGRQAAMRDATEHRFQNRDARFGGSNSYGNDPYPPRG